MRFDRLASMCAVILLVWICSKVVDEKDQPSVEVASAPPAAAPPLSAWCKQWNAASPVAKRAKLQGFLASLNPYDYMPGCLEYPRNFQRVADLAERFCTSSVHPSELALGRGLEERAGELCGRR